MATDARQAVTWWGHSTVTVQWAGQRLLFDPVLGNSVGHLRRRRGPTPAPDARQADAVIVSHLHADHCHIPSLRLIAPATPVIGPAGIGAFLRRAMGDAAPTCRELVDGDEVVFGDLVVRALFADHDDRRSPLSRHRARPLSFLVTEGASTKRSLWFGGDTALHEAIAAVAPVDVALVPVGGWGPGLGPGHLDGVQAADAVRLLAAGVAIPIHYGTLWPRGLDWVGNDQFLGPERQFEQRAATIAPQTAVHILSPGETIDTS